MSAPDLGRAGPLRILYDHQIFASQRHGGISRYFCELAARLAADPTFDIRVCAPLHANAHLAGLGGVKVRGMRVPDLPKTRRPRMWAARSLEPLAAWPGWADIVHETYYRPTRVRAPRSRTIVTIHDLAQETLPEHFGADLRQTVAAKTAAVRRADAIVCVSGATRAALLDRYEVDPRRVHVVHHGCNPLPSDCAPRPMPGPYLLYVGQRGGYKNFDRLLQAYASSGLHRDVALVCFGGERPGAERTTARRLGIPEGRLVHVGGDDRRLACFYAHARAFVYPSLLEGFGIPLLEAMALGCPVLCSDSSAFPEVAGEAADYFDARSVESIRAVLERCVGSDAWVARRRLDGPRQAARFSWDRAARETAAVYLSCR
jgi:glycosyltransferase involved in cell wall biosynthesis